MNLSDFEQYFYREPTVESVTAGGNFQLLDITDEEKRGAEEFIHVCFCLAFHSSSFDSHLEKWSQWFRWISFSTIGYLETTSIRYRCCWIEV